MLQTLGRDNGELKLMGKTKDLGIKEVMTPNSEKHSQGKTRNKADIPNMLGSKICNKSKMLD